MKKLPRFVLSVSALSLFAGVVGPLAGCRTVPGTGRSQLNMVDESQLDASAAQEFSNLKKTQKLSADPVMNATLKRVGARIVSEARKVDGSLPPFAQWEFIVVQDNTANAFAMPGGKVAFNTGIFPLMSCDDEIAVVMGHEVSHVICRHGNERVSQGMVAQLGGAVLQAGTQNSKYADLIMAGYGAGAQYGAILPFSRTHESEADKLGIHLAAKAGYDPQVAIGFWEKMSAGGGQPPEFLSTHPSGSTRINDLRKEMPTASAEYQKAKASGLPPGERLNFPKSAGGGSASSAKKSQSGQSLAGTHKHDHTAGW